MSIIVHHCPFLMRDSVFSINFKGEWHWQNHPARSTLPWASPPVYSPTNKYYGLFRWHPRRHYDLRAHPQRWGRYGNSGNMYCIVAWSLFEETFHSRHTAIFLLLCSWLSITASLFCKANVVANEQNFDAIKIAILRTALKPVSSTLYHPYYTHHHFAHYHYLYFTFSCSLPFLHSDIIFMARKLSVYSDFRSLLLLYANMYLYCVLFSPESVNSFLIVSTSDISSNWTKRTSRTNYCWACDSFRKAWCIKAREIW